MTTATIDRAEIYKDLESVGANIPDHVFAGWDDETLALAGDWAEAVYSRAVGNDVEVPETPLFVRVWLDTEGQSDPVAMAQDIEQPGVTLEERTDNLDRMNRKVQAIMSAECDVQTSEAEWNDSKAETKERKADFDSAVNRMRKIIRSDIDQKELPFDDSGAVDDDGEAAKTESERTDIGQLAKGGRYAPGLTPAIIEGMRKAEIDSVEELDKRMRSDEWWHRNIKGVGPTKIDAITDTLMDFQKQNPDWTDRPVATDGGPDSEDTGEESPDAVVVDWTNPIKTEDDREGDNPPAA